MYGHLRRRNHKKELLDDEDSMEANRHVEYQEDIELKGVKWKMESKTYSKGKLMSKNPTSCVVDTNLQEIGWSKGVSTSPEKRVERDVGIEEEVKIWRFQ